MSDWLSGLIRKRNGDNPNRTQRVKLVTFRCTMGKGGCPISNKTQRNSILVKIIVIRSLNMKYIARAICALILLTGTATAFPVSETMSNPYAGFNFPVEENRYELIPKEDYEKYGLWDGPHWIFASYTDEEDGAHYLVTSGFITQWLDSVPPTPGPLEPDFGVLLKGTGGIYKKLGVADSVFGQDAKVNTKVPGDFWIILWRGV